MSEETRTAGTVARAVRLISAIADAEEPGSVTALAAATGLPASTIHRLLALLVSEGMVERDAAFRTYRVGPELYRIAARTVATVGLAEIAKPTLQELADEFDETVLFGRYSAATASMSFVARADGGNLLQYRIELNVPGSVIWGSSGKAVSAYLPKDAVRRAMEADRLRGDGGRSIGGTAQPGEAELMVQFEEIERRGYALSEAEKLPKARGIAVPVFGPAGVEGSLTLTHPRDRPPAADVAAIVERLQQGAAQIGRSLGAAGGK